MKKLFLMAAATSSIIMAANQYHPQNGMTPDGIASLSYHAPIPTANGGVWFQGALYTKEGLAYLRQMPAQLPGYQHASPKTKESARITAPTETTWERVNKQCAAIELMLPESIKPLMEKAIEEIESTVQDAAETNITNKVWGHISLGHARKLTPLQAKKHFLTAIELASGKKEFVLEWKVATIGLINSLFDNSEVLRALLLLHKFEGAANSIVQGKREEIASSLQPGWEDRLMETDWIQAMDKEYQQKTIKKIHKAIKFFKSEIFSTGKDRWTF